MRGNPQNLTHGLRRLKFSAKLANADQVEEIIAGVVQNFDKSVRNEVMNDATVLLEHRAIHYIREGKKASGIMSKLGGVHPRSQGLERSFRSFSHETDTVTVSMGAGIDYAELHNLPPGETRTIMPQNGRFLLFRWYRLEKASRIAAQSVERPGVGYWDRALEDVRDNMKRLIKKKIDEAIMMGNENIMPSTGARLAGRPRLKNNAKVRSQRI